MKVSTQNSTSATKKSKKKLTADEIKAQVLAKFGDKAKPKKAPKPKEKVEVKTKVVEEKQFGDVSKNDPNSDVTQEKLRNILKTGAFNFNEKERKALSKILK